MSDKIPTYIASNYGIPSEETHHKYYGDMAIDSHDVARFIKSVAEVGSSVDAGDDVAIVYVKRVSDGKVFEFELDIEYEPTFTIVSSKEIEYDDER